jgi:light-regulated signal transduction histidine kinase (bacteriophytochrome)
MGLAISRAILEAHHGTLGVTSQVGEGSVYSRCRCLMARQAALMERLL